MTSNSTTHTPDPDEHKGAIEGDRPEDEQQGNENAQEALNEDGSVRPGEQTPVCEDVIGANNDETQG